MRNRSGSASNVRGHASIKQIEVMHVAGKSLASIPQKARLHFKGTNCGDVCGPCAVPSWESPWRLDFAAKKRLFGQKRCAMAEDEEDEDAEDMEGDELKLPLAFNPDGTYINEKRTARKDEHEEPVFYQDILTKEVYAEQLHGLNITSGIIDLCPGQGTLAELAAEQ